VSEQPYKQPPITESVIEIRFADPIASCRNWQRLANTFKSTYPLEQIVTDISVQLYFQT